jgi:hypothetical protein
MLSTSRQFAATRLTFITCLLMMVTSITALAQVPQKLNYQGFLATPGTGAPITTPVGMPLSITIKLYNTAVGGAALYTETHPVSVNNGIFNIVVGSVTALTLPFDVPYFLGITVGADAEMTPRQPLVASAYALRAASNADGAVTLAKIAANGCTNLQTLLFNGTGWVCGNATGPQGPQGIQGIQGLAGPQGAQGIQGLTGATGAVGASGAAGTNGTNGTNGIDGKTIRTGAGVLAGAIGVDGDFYIDTVGNNIYGPKTAGIWGAATSLVGPIGATGTTGATGATGAASNVPGPQGIQGIAGTNGTNGTDGKTILSGTIAPTAGTGVNGDFYIDTVAKNIYGPKTAGAWGAATSIVGPAGPTGATGAIGPTGLTGATGSVGATGAAGATGATGAASNVPGPQGIQGTAGTNGTNGTNGIDGKTIRNGAGVPAGATGVDGDFYIDTVGNNIYGPKTAGAWGAATSIVGPAGATGATGNVGPQGAIGPQGIQGLTGLTGATGATGAASNVPGPQGIQGTAGTNGTNGTNGMDGKTILSGTIAPAVGVGVNGDFYIDTIGKNIYGPKTAGAWGAATSIVGPAGPQGAQGIQGTPGATGAQGNPGATGATGAQGNPGATGATGAQGPQGMQGPAGASGSAKYAITINGVASTALAKPLHPVEVTIQPFQVTVITTTGYLTAINATGNVSTTSTASFTGAGCTGTALVSVNNFPPGVVIAIGSPIKIYYIPRAGATIVTNPARASSSTSGTGTCAGPTTSPLTGDYYQPIEIVGAAAINTSGFGLAATGNGPLVINYVP